MDFTKLHLHWRVSRYKGKEYKSYSLARSYRKEGQNRKEIVFKLGKLTNNAVEQWRNILRFLKNPNITLADVNNLIIVNNRAYLDIAVAYEAWNSWDLDKIFDKNKTTKDISLSAIVASLAINRCIDPVSKSRVPIWFDRTILPFMLNVDPAEMNSSRIFRELANIEACKNQITQHLCNKMLQAYPQAMQSLFYDLSSTTFTGTQCILVKWGYCKEGYCNHVVLALVVNILGLPLYWEVLEGGTADAKTISWLLSNLKERLPIAIPTMVFDRGMVSENNLDLLEKANVKYITAMDRNQIEKISNFNFEKFSKLSKEKREQKLNKEFLKIDANKSKEDSVIDKRRYILCFNQQLNEEQHKIREKAILDFQEYVKKLNWNLQLAKKRRKVEVIKNKIEKKLKKFNLQTFITIHLEEIWISKQTRDICTYQVKVKIDNDKKRQAGKLDGFWMLVTNHSEKTKDVFSKDIKSIVTPYHEKVVIEASFRDIKSFIEVAPVHVWKKEHVQAHYTVCVLSYLIDRTLTLVLHENKGRESKKIVSHARLYEELAECRLNRIKFKDTNNETYSLTQRTAIQNDLLNRLDMTHLVNESMLNFLCRRAKMQS